MADFDLWDQDEIIIEDQINDLEMSIRDDIKRGVPRHVIKQKYKNEDFFDDALLNSCYPSKRSGGEHYRPLTLGEKLESAMDYQFMNRKAKVKHVFIVVLAIAVVLGCFIACHKIL